MKEKKQRFVWTEEDIQKLYGLWEDKSNQDIADEIGRGCTKESVSYMAGVIRKNGYPIQHKRKNNTVALLVKEAMKNLGVKQVTKKK